jgi:hypothetical protein
VSDGADPIAAFVAILEEAGLGYALIGGHAVNAWIEPRFTADVDFTVEADPDRIAAVQARLLEVGYRIVREVGHGQPSGPDFIRFARGVDDPPLDLQVAKTAYQAEVVRRARGNAPTAVATPEDLIVLKLIANRPKDLIDLRNLVALPALDWEYIDRWATAWDVLDRLLPLRPG